jgi:hypothetical protein
MACVLKEMRNKGWLLCASLEPKYPFGGLGYNKVRTRVKAEGKRGKL